MISADEQTGEVLALLRRVLGAELLAVYLYGSSTIGGLQRYSDLDLFAVVARPTTRAGKAALAETLLTISGLYRSPDRRPVELTIVVQSDIKPWRYPPRFDFQYGDWLRPQFAAGEIEPWPNKSMPDLALLVTQLLLASRTLYGPDAAMLLPPVPAADVLHAITDGLASLRSDLVPDTRNVLLTLARIWLTVETGAIGSKPQAAHWALDRLPPDLRPALQRALDATIGAAPDLWDDFHPQAAATADAMLAEIARPRAIPAAITLAR